MNKDFGAVLADIFKGDDDYGTQKTGKTVSWVNRNYDDMGTFTDKISRKWKILGTNKRPGMCGLCKNYPITHIFKCECEYHKDKKTVIYNHKGDVKTAFGVCNHGCMKTAQTYLNDEIDWATFSTTWLLVFDRTIRSLTDQCDQKEEIEKEEEKEIEKEEEKEIEKEEEETEKEEEKEIEKEIKKEKETEEETEEKETKLKVIINVYENLIRAEKERKTKERKIKNGRKINDAILLAKENHKLIKKYGKPTITAANNISETYADILRDEMKLDDIWIIYVDHFCGKIDGIYFLLKGEEMLYKFRVSGKNKYIYFYKPETSDDVLKFDMREVFVSWYTISGRKWKMGFKHSSRTYPFNYVKVGGTYRHKEYEKIILDAIRKDIDPEI